MFLLFQDYVLIDAEKGCSHAKDDAGSKFFDITSCLFKDSIHNVSYCEEYCSTHQSCVGYEYLFVKETNDGICQLYPSDESCPSEFQLYKENYTANSFNDLVPGHELQDSDKLPHDILCYAKKPGNIC